MPDYNHTNIEKNKPLATPLLNCLSDIFCALNEQQQRYVMIGIPEVGSFYFPCIVDMLCLEPDIVEGLAVKYAMENDIVICCQRNESVSLIMFTNPSMDLEVQQWVLMYCLKYFPDQNGRRINIDNVIPITRPDSNMKYFVPNIEAGLALSVLRILQHEDHDDRTLLNIHTLLIRAKDEDNVHLAKYFNSETMRLIIRSINKDDHASIDFVMKLRTKLLDDCCLFGSNLIKRQTFPTIFFVIAGTHGVGKSTTVTEVSRILSHLPFGYQCFHHVLDTGLKNEREKLNSISDSKKINYKCSRVIIMRKLWHWLLPGIVKKVIIASLDEVRYIRRVTNKIIKICRAGNFALSDRYIYDRWVDLRIRNRSVIQIAAVRLAANFMRKPSLTIILTDKPENIYQRKQELTQDEICRYQDDLRLFCTKNKIAKKEISVQGMKPGIVASGVVRAMLDAIGGDLLYFYQYQSCQKHNIN